MSYLIDKTVYCTLNADAIGVYQDWVKAEKGYRRRLKRAMKDLGVEAHQPMMSRTFGTERWVGITTNGNLANPPLGWRYDRKQMCLVPYKKLPEGKAVAKVIDATQPPRHPANYLPGMRSFYMAGFSNLTPGLEMHGDTLYVIWGMRDIPETDPKGEVKIDRSIWERVPMSEFIAMLEAEEASR